MWKHIQKMAKSKNKNFIKKYRGNGIKMMKEEKCKWGTNMADEIMRIIKFPQNRLAMLI